VFQEIPEYKKMHFIKKYQHSFFSHTPGSQAALPLLTQSLHSNRTNNGLKINRDEKKKGKSTLRVCG